MRALLGVVDGFGKEMVVGGIVIYVSGVFVTEI